MGMGMTKSPALAGVLSAMPGLGHVYLGLYQRALTFFAIWVACITITSNAHNAGPIGLMIPFWWFFVLIDAVRQAKAINTSGAPEANLAVTELSMKSGGNLTMGVVLILVGLFFLIDKFVTIDLSFLWDWSPLLLVAFGAWLVFSYYKTKQASEGETGSGSTSV
jgi:hypothetical protein